MGLFRKTKFRIDDYTKQDIEARLNKPSGWVDKAISDINSLGEKRDASQVVASSDTDIRFSLDVSSIISEDSFNEWDSSFQKKTFQEELLDYIDQKGMTNREFYKAAFLDRKLFSAIKNNVAYQPSKETAVACCFGLKLSLNEARDLLGLAGYELSLSIKWDKVVYYCLENEIYDFDSINYLFYLLHEKGIRTNGE